MPAAIRATFDVDGVVEIARGLSIDSHDRQVPEIFAAGALDLIDGLRATRSSSRTSAEKECGR